MTLRIHTASFDRKKDRFVRPLAKIAIKAGLTPMQCSLISFFFGIISAVEILFGSWFALLFFALHVLFDLFDGTIARMKKITSEIGAWIDMVMDRTVEMLIVIALILGRWVPVEVFYLIVIFHIIAYAWFFKIHSFPKVGK